jgi:hypothetical protein
MQTAIQSGDDSNQTIIGFLGYNLTNIESLYQFICFLVYAEITIPSDVLQKSDSSAGNVAHNYLQKSRRRRHFLSFTFALLELYIY